MTQWTQPPIAVPLGPYDARLQPELFEGVLARRSVAFFIDATLILLFTASAYLITFLLGFFTLGLIWLLFGLVFPAVALAIMP